MILFRVFPSDYGSVMRGLHLKHEQDQINIHYTDFAKQKSANLSKKNYSKYKSKDQKNRDRNNCLVSARMLGFNFSNDSTETIKQFIKVLNLTDTNLTCNLDNYGCIF